MFYKEYVLRVKRLQISSDVVGSQVEKAANIRFAKFASCSSNLPGWGHDHDDIVIFLMIMLTVHHHHDGQQQQHDHYHVGFMI